jgi:DNA-binding MarR family transcriptional regulator
MVRFVNSSSIEVSAAARSLPSFVDRVATLVPQLCRAVVRQESNYVIRGELTLPQLWALELLRLRGTCQMSEVLRALQLKSSTGTVFVDRLCRMGLVRRERDNKDRRAVDVTLTAKGRRALDEIDEHRKAGMLTVFKPFNARERAAYLVLLEKLVLEMSKEKEGSS